MACSGEGLGIKVLPDPEFNPTEETARPFGGLTDTSGMTINYSGTSMGNAEIRDLRRIFTTRLDTLEHILAVGEKHLSDIDASLSARLAPDMLPLGAQIAFACNQPRGFAYWCAGQAIDNLDPDVTSIVIARSYIRDTQSRLDAIEVSDLKLDEMKQTGLGPGLYCETSGRLYVSDYLVPNFYFHITTTYAILRMLGVPLGKADYMRFLMPHVKQAP